MPNFNRVVTVIAFSGYGRSYVQGNPVERRDWLRTVGGLAAGTVLAQRQADAQAQAARAARALPSPIIRDIQVIETAPQGLRLVVVKVITDQDGLYGYGCGTFTQRADLVKPAVERYLKPLLVGRPADRIDDTWQMAYNGSYWRNEPVLNNAISGVDMALWDIKGRQTGLPVYQLLGGKLREAADCYAHASGGEISEVVERVKEWQARGFRHVRMQVGVPGMAGYGSGAGSAAVAKLHDDPVFEPAAYIRRALTMFEKARQELGFEIELLHDVHERITPTQALQLCKDMEQFKLFFLEDPVSPEDIAWFRLIRQQCTTPLAMGQLFNSPHEWSPLIAERLIDYIRVHVSQAGGLTPCRKMAVLAEFFGVRTAWHGPGDVSPIGHACNVALDLASYNFGVQEYSPFGERTQEVFSGCPRMENGYLEVPGWGIEVDEKAAAKYPFWQFERGERERLNGGWGVIRNEMARSSSSSVRFLPIAGPAR
jgi:mannonate dehydratase